MFKTLNGCIEDDLSYATIPLMGDELFKVYNEAFLWNQVEIIECLPHYCLFIDNDLENICIIYDHINTFSKNFLSKKIWTMHFYGEKSNVGTSVEMVFNPLGGK